MAKQGIKTKRLSVELNQAAMEVVINVQHRVGEAFVTKESQEFAFNALPKTIQERVSLYGLNKLLQDRTSQLRTPDGDLGQVLVAIGEVYDMLAGGEFSAKRKAGKAENDDAVLIAVLADQLKKPVAVVAVMFAKLPADQKKGLAAKYADQVAEAKAAAEDDASDFFAEM